ncbi:type II toxin-antitoxin system RelE family toxin [Trueperella pyogenes]|uniref:type II toxin-antitoxin system RelE family toxin n=1 Tax=Trueperella pyogenes TaxID=1661 RepID=UPI0032442DB9
MAWRIEVAKDFQKALKKLDRPTVKRVISKLREIEKLDDPRLMGKALVGNLAGLWRYRVGDYRIICSFEDETLVVLVLDVAHRSKSYR